MKKSILFFLFSSLFCLSINAQTDYDQRLKGNVEAYMQNLESNITLTPEEKTKIYDLKKQHTENFWKISSEFKDKPELDEKRKEVNMAYGKNIIEAFGRERGLAILNAAKPKKQE